MPFARCCLLMLALAAAGVRAEGLAEAQLLPALPAQPGECYAVVFVPPQFETTVETVEVAPATERVETVPPRYEWVEEQVSIPAGSRREIVTPAVVEWTEQTVATPARERRIAVPAKYKTVEEKIATAHGPVLKQGKSLPGSQDAGVYCLVDGPTAFTTVKKKVLLAPASSRSETIPAGSRVVRQKRVITPAVTRRVPTPERLVTRRVKRLVEPAGERRIAVAARVAPVQHQRIRVPGRMEWRRVLCQTNTTPQLLRAVQAALQQRGWYRGSLDGRFGASSQAALSAWQRAENLPQGLTIEALDQLGVAP